MRGHTGRVSRSKGQVRASLSTRLVPMLDLLRPGLFANGQEQTGADRSRRPGNLGRSGTCSGALHAARDLGAEREAGCEAAMGSDSGNRGRPEATLDASELSCVICHDLLLEPVVAACGLDFCRVCYSAWTVKQQSCPMCRQRLPREVPGAPHEQAR